MGTPTSSSFLYTNLATSGNYSCNYANSSYPASNLCNNDIHITSRSTTSTNVKWTIDLGALLICDCIGIAGCNFSANATIQMSLATTSTPSYSSVTNFSPPTHIWYRSTSGSLRYATCSVTDTSLSYLEIGEMWVGAHVDTTYYPQIPMNIKDMQDQVIQITKGGQTWSFYNHRKRGYDLTFIEDITPTIYTNVLRDLWRTKGSIYPFFFRLAPNDTNDKAMWCRIETFDFRIDGPDKRPGRLSLVEDI